MSENSSGAPPFRSPVRDCGVRRCVPRRSAPAPRPSFARPTDFRHAPACRRPVRRGAFRLRRRTARAELVRSALPGRIVFSPAFSGCRRIHPGRRLSDRPCGIAASADAVRGGVLPPCGPLSPARRIFGTPRQCRRPVRRGAFRLRQRTARAAQPRRSGAAAATVQLRKPPPRPDAEAPRLRGDRSAGGSCGDASRSSEPRSSHGRSPPLSPESCGTPAPCGCSPVRKRLRTKHRTGAVSPPRNSHIRENPGSAERTERGGRAASVAERKIRMLRDAESPGEARKAPPAGRKGCGRCRAADRTGGGADFRTGRVCLSCCRGSARSDPSAALFVPDPRPAVSGIGPGVFRLPAAFRAPFGGPRRTKTQMHPASAPGSFPASAFASGPSARRKSEPIRVRCRFIRTFAA